MTLKNIQISRGLAALAVLLAHANLLIDRSLFGGAFIIGWCGVDFFFVLSGFIIYYTCRQHQGVASALPGYLVKRARRVYPIYWIYTLGALALSALVTLATGRALITWMDSSPLGLLRSLLLLPTDVPANVMPPLPIAWTLSYEVMFYVLFGFSFVLRARLTLALAAVWVLVVAARSAGLIGPFPPDSLPFLFSAPRNLEFLAGCVAAWWITSRRPASNLALPMTVTGLLLLATAWINALAGFRWMPEADTLQFGLPFFLLVAGVALFDVHRTAERDGPLRRLGVFLGNASYSIYLTHFVVILVVGILGRQLKLPSMSIFGLSAFAALLIGILGYRFVERPLMRSFGAHSRSSNLARPIMHLSLNKIIRPVLYALLGMALAIAAIERLPQQAMQQYQASGLIKTNAWPYAETMRIRDRIAASQSQRLAMLGDSLTEWGHWQGGLAGYTLLNDGVGGDKTSDILRRLGAVERQKPAKVMLMAGINDLFTAVPQAETMHNYEAIVTRLRASGAEVVAVSVLPLSRLNSRFAETNVKVRLLNIEIQALALRLGIPYLDLTPTLTSPPDFALNDAFTVDSVHLSNLGYAKWTIRLDDYLHEAK